MKTKKLTIVVGALMAGASVAAWALEPLKPGAYMTTLEMQFPGAPQPMRMTQEDCITEADSKNLSAVLMRELAGQQQCKLSNLKTTSNSMTFDMHCNVEGTVADSKVEMTSGGDWFKALMTMRMGKDVITSKVDSKWVKAACVPSED